MGHRQKRPGDSDATQQPAEKTCASCGRRIEWRAKWAKNWEAVTRAQQLPCGSAIEVKESALGGHRATVDYTC